MVRKKIDWSDRRIIVTGGNGFIGSRLTQRLLAEGADVYSLDKVAGNLQVWPLPGRRWLKADIVEPRLLAKIVRRIHPDLVFHLAAQSQVGAAFEKPAECLRDNLLGTWNVLEAARIHEMAVVVASSDKAYGVSETLPYTEEQPLSASFIYDTSKTCADLLSQSYFTTYGMQLSISRCGNVYGPGDLNWDRIVPHVLSRALRGRRPILRSDGKPRRDYLFLDDAVDAYLELGLATLAGPKAVAYNFGTGEPVRVLALVRRILTAIGRLDLMPATNPGPSKEIPDQFLSSKRAQSHLGWKPHFSLDSGLRKTIPWYATYLGRESPMLNERLR